MNGEQWADCLGKLATEEPLKSALANLGRQPTLSADGLNLEFSAGRLCAVRFDPTVFVGPLPAALERTGPLPRTFTPFELPNRVIKADQRFVVRVRGGQKVFGLIDLHVLEYNDVRFLVELLVVGDPAKLCESPLSAALESLATAKRPRTSGIDIGYNMGWFAVRAASVADIAASLRLVGPETISADKAIDARVTFISAPRGDWRLVLWATSDDVEEGFDSAQRLSRELGTQVCFFATQRVVESYAYSRYDCGTCVRAWWTEDGRVRRNEGRRLPDEPAGEIDEDAVRKLARKWSTEASVPRADGHRLSMRR
jgi:hypothetical protein